MPGPFARSRHRRPNPLWCQVLVLIVAAAGPRLARAQQPTSPAVSAHAREVHAAGMIFDGHNDLPWRLRTEGDQALRKFDLSKRLTSGHTDIPRLRDGGVKAQFWSVYIPSEHKDPAITVMEQIDLVKRMVARYPADLEMAYSADDVERIVKAGKIASLIGIEGGVAIENRLSLLRTFHALGARYMTLAHNATLDWVDAALDVPRHDGLTAFGERVVREMNRLGILVDISHVSPATMADVLRVSRAPVIASHSSAFARCPSPRNVPDDILKLVRQNGGVVMVNFFPGFIVPEFGALRRKALFDIQAKFPDPAARRKAMQLWFESDAARPAKGAVRDVADHIDHLVKVAGVDHVGLGSDFDGIVATPVGLEDVSCYPRITQALLDRGYQPADIHKIMGQNALRALRKAGEVARALETAEPEIDDTKPEPLGD